MNQNVPIVFVIDDDFAVRRAIDALLQSAGLRVEGFSSASEFLQQPIPADPCCLVLDVRLPVMSGIELHRHLQSIKWSIPTIFITGHADIPMAVEAMKNGAIDFLTKPIRGQVLLDAILKAVRISEERTRVEALRRSVNSMTSREREVIEHVIAGWTNREIASELGTGERNIKNHRANGMRKIGAKTVPELVRMASKISMRHDFSRESAARVG